MPGQPSTPQPSAGLAPSTLVPAFSFSAKAQLRQAPF